MIILIQTFIYYYFFFKPYFIYVFYRNIQNWKNANINRPKLVLRREIVFKEDIPKKYLQKKAEGPFLVI